MVMLSVKLSAGKREAKTSYISHDPEAAVLTERSHVITNTSDAEFNPNGMLVQRYREASLEPMCEGSGL
jgi:hypothetical protein